MPVTWAEYRATAILFMMFVVTMVTALMLVPAFTVAGLDQTFEDSNDWKNAIWYVALVLVFTMLILAIAKWGKKAIIQFIILGAVASVIFYVVYGLWVGNSANPPYTFAALVGLGLGIAGAVLLYFHPEWYVIDATGLVMAAGSAAIFGISLAVWPVIVLLVLLAIYDAIAVYKTKHMLALADTVIDLRLPVLMVIPKHGGYSFRSETAAFKKANKENKGEREAMFMGLGDLVMPSILVVSAYKFGFEAWGMWPVLGAAVGTLAGFLILMTFVLRGNPQAGLPLLNGGSILGFLIALYASNQTLMFW